MADMYEWILSGALLRQPARICRLFHAVMPRQVTLIWRVMVFAMGSASICHVASAGEAPDFSKIEITPVKVAENLYMIDQSAAAGGSVSFLIGDDGVLLVDTGIAPMAPKVEAAIRKLTSLPIRYVLNTHLHIDVTDGNEHFSALGAVMVAQEEVRSGLLHPVKTGNTPIRKPMPASGLPKIVFDRSFRLHFNREDIHMIAVPRAHTRGDSLIHFAGADVIVAGDTLRPGSYPSMNRPHGGTLQGMLDALATLIGRSGPDTRIITTHGEVVARDAAVRQRDDILLVRDRIATLIRQGRSEQQIVDGTTDIIQGVRIDPRWGHTAAERFVHDVYAELTVSP